MESSEGKVRSERRRGEEERRGEGEEVEDGPAGCVCGPRRAMGAWVMLGSAKPPLALLRLNVPLFTVRVAPAATAKLVALVELPE